MNTHIHLDRQWWNQLRAVYQMQMPTLLAFNALFSSFQNALLSSEYRVIISRCITRYCKKIIMRFWNMINSSSSLSILFKWLSGPLYNCQQKYTFIRANFHISYFINRNHVTLVHSLYMGTAITIYSYFSPQCHKGSGLMAIWMISDLCYIFSLMFSRKGPVALRNGSIDWSVMIWAQDVL